MMTYSEIKSEFKMDDWRYDPFGTAYSWLFRIADSLEFYHEAGTPDEWQFRPSPMGRGDDPAEDSIALSCDLTDPDELTRFGRVLNRYIDKLKVAGKSY